MNKTAPAFWVTNISDMNVSLADLNLTIKAFSSVNLLDQRHYKYTKEQLVKSAESGSIFKKRNKIVVRKFAPEITQANLPVLRDTFIPNKAKSIYEIKQTNYEELNVSDEQFAEENADLDSNK